MKYKLNAKNFGKHYISNLKSVGKSFEGVEVLVRASSGWSPSKLKTRVGIVGTRKPSSYGLRFVDELIGLLASLESKPLIVSGGAMGVDTWSHQRALYHGLETEAWVVGPIEKPNPRSNEILFRAIESESAVLCPSVLEPADNRPLRRSDWVIRIAFLAARSDVIVVPEANIKSGTWHTVTWANKIGIPVFALPGPVDAVSSLGTNRMISMGYAHPAPSANYLLKEFLVHGVRNFYNVKIEKQSTDSGTIGFEAAEKWLSTNGVIDLENLPELSKILQVDLGELCQWISSELRQGHFSRLGNTLERITKAHEPKN